MAGKQIKSFFKDSGRFLRKNIRIIASFVYVLCIAVVIFVSIRFFSRRDSTFGILFSTTLSCFLMIPIVHNLEFVFAERHIKEDSEAQKKIRELKIQNELLAEEKKSALKRLQILEDNSFSTPRYADVFKLGFKSITQEGTFVRREKIESEPLNFTEHPFKVATAYNERHFDEALIATHYSISGLCGIDLSKIRIARTAENSVLIRGLEVEFVSEPSVHFKTELSELRHISLHRDGREKHITIDSSAESKLFVLNLQDSYQKEFEVEFKKLELEKAKKAVFVQAKNYLKKILNPWFTVTDESFDSATISATGEELPLAIFLQKEAVGYKERFCATEEGREFLKGLDAI